MDFATAPGLQKMLEQATDYCRQTERFTRDPKYTEFKTDDEDGLVDLHGKHDAVVEQVGSWFKKAEDPVMATTASKIGATIRRFQQAEAANAAAVDRAVPSRIDTVDVSLPAWPKTTTTEQYIPKGPFVYPEDPADALREPRSYENDPDLSYRPKFYDFLAPSAAGGARATVWKVTEFMASLGLGVDRAYDPFEVFTKPLVGDWAGLRRYADVLRYAGDAAERTGIGIDRARHMLGPVWRGRAADACVVWLGAVAKPMRDAPNALDTMADAYQRAAEGAAGLRSMIDEALTTLIDQAVIVAGAVAIGSGGATVTGGISAGVAAVVVGAEIAYIAWLISNLFDLMTKYDALKAALAAVQNDFGKLHAGGQMPYLPPVSGDASALSVLPA